MLVNPSMMEPIELLARFIKQDKTSANNVECGYKTILLECLHHIPKEPSFYYCKYNSYDRAAIEYGFKFNDHYGRTIRA